MTVGSSLEFMGVAVGVLTVYGLSRPQVLPVPDHAGGLWPGGPHVVAGVRRGGAGGGGPQRVLRGQQGAPVAHVERRGNAAHRRHHAGTRRQSDHAALCRCVSAK